MHKAALFEVDKTRLPERMAQAEKAVVLRARELFYFTQPETTSKRGQLWMMRCTPCMLCGTDHKLTAVLRLLRSTHRCCAIPFLGSACRHGLARGVIRARRREITMLDLIKPALK